MKVIVNGACGKMGQVMQQMLSQREDASLATGVDIHATQPGIVTALEQAAPADVIIDFSFHSAIGNVLDYACKQYLPVVIATTGHTPEELEQISDASKKIPVFHSGNMSLGVALLCNLAKKAAAVFPDADIEIIETHHNHKVDAPSGTALMLANAMGQVRQNSANVFGRHGMQPRKPGEIGIHSVRRGEIVGIHEVQISTPTQTITLKHEAHTRALFAEGALAAAQFLLTQPAGLYSMEDMVR